MKQQKMTETKKQKKNLIEVPPAVKKVIMFLESEEILLNRQNKNKQK